MKLISEDTKRHEHGQGVSAEGDAEPHGKIQPETHCPAREDAGRSAADATREPATRQSEAWAREPDRTLADEGKEERAGRPGRQSQVQGPSGSFINTSLHSLSALGRQGRSRATHRNACHLRRHGALPRGLHPPYVSDDMRVVNATAGARPPPRARLTFSRRHIRSVNTRRNYASLKSEQWTFAPYGSSCGTTHSLRGARAEKRAGAGERVPGRS